MILILIIDCLAVAWLCTTASRKGFEATLPVAAFLLMLFPVESQIKLPGLLDLTTQRIVVATLVLLYFSKGREESWGSGGRPIPFKNLIALVIVWMLVASANSVVPDVSFKSTLSQCLDYFVTYYIFAKSVTKVETVNKILYGFVASMFVCSIFGMLEVYRNWTVLSLFPSTAHHFSDLPGAVTDRGIRAQSTFGHPILFGAALALAIPIALYLLTVVQSKGQRVFVWIAILSMVLCIYQTESRGPWLALGISLGLLLFLGEKQMRKTLTVIALLTVAVLVLRPGVWHTIADLYGETISTDTAQGESYQWRYVLFNISKQELSKSFSRSLWGYGPESFYYLGLTTEALTDGEMHTVKVESCDSAVVELMMDTGYVGFSLIVLVLLRTALAAFRNRRKLPPPANALCSVFLVNIVAFCFLMTNVQLFGWGQQSYMLWVLIALAMTYPAIVCSPVTVEGSSQIAPALVDALPS